MKEYEIDEQQDNCLEELAKVLLLVTAEESPVWITPDQLMEKVVNLPIPSKRDLAFKMNRLGLRTRVLSKDGVYARYYFIHNNDLRHKMEVLRQTTKKRESRMEEVQAASDTRKDATAENKGLNDLPLLFCPECEYACRAWNPKSRDSRYCPRCYYNKVEPYYYVLDNATTFENAKTLQRAVTATGRFGKMKILTLKKSQQAF